MKVQFTLRSQNQDDKGAIYLQVFDRRLKGRRFRHATRLYIEPQHCAWVDSKAGGKVKGGAFERIKIGKNLTPIENSRLTEINEYLKKLRAGVEAYETTKTKSSTLDSAELKVYLDSLKDDDRKRATDLDQEKKQKAEEQLQKELDFFKIWQDIIDTTKNPKSGQKITAGTKIVKTQTKNKVVQFCNANGITPTFESIDMNFYHEFGKYMEAENLKANTRGRHFKELKAILRECADRDYPVNTAYTKKSFKVIRQDVDNIYLSEDQIQALLDADLSPALAKQRDIFVMACYVGARHSDWHQIRQNNIVEGIANKEGKVTMGEALKITQKKTKDTIHIPLHPMVRAILQKYNGIPPRIISNQKFNTDLKVIGEKAKLKDWKGLKTHTARRSFCTNAYSAGMDVHLIMYFSGHKTESSFMKYLKLQGRDYAILASVHDFFQPKAQMKIAV